MYTTKFLFCLMSFHLNNFSFIVFKDKILFLFNSKSQMERFHPNSLYFLYLAEPSGAIILKLPLMLTSLEDSDNGILNLYMAINCF